MNAKDKKNVTVTAQGLAERGYSVSKAAAAAGVSTTHLCAVLRGKRTPSAELVQRLRSLPKYHPVPCRFK